ncbi:hypothetical protein DOTSEDRAFT_31262 [Dothistroma septosporum NZE10]|uniref:EF-hand domain-containing protein n=1 Tax=Dothistroma septosporum (strain NZE10 / CBS 128990) TaxID=675120 RepID=N1Q394_DOTSN|nr:hypothetical protein DOTSEDRAFT_31262 [Dothistroma septosporum NZE10]
MANRPSPFDNAASRQSPFRRQNSASPATVRGGTPGSSPTKAPSALSLSPTKAHNLSLEKTSPFVRRPSQINTERPSSPFARPSSSLSKPASPSRQPSNSSLNGASLSLSPRPSSPMRMRSISRAPEEPDTPTVLSPAPPSRFEGAKPSLQILCKDSPPPPESSQAPAMVATPAMLPSPAILRPVAQRTVTSSTTATIKQPVFTSQPPRKSPTMPKLNSIGVGGGAYGHVPQSLLHSLRESFEVLDSNNTGGVTAASVSEMLSQMGMDNSPAALHDFFPPNGPAQFNLARYLDVCSGPLADMSQPDELRAAFEAFDVDDSGQIDVATLRDALLHTVPEPGEDMIRLTEREVDGILGDFTGRRAFGSKGLNASNAKGEVFRYRDFISNISAGGAQAENGEAVMAA